MLRLKKRKDILLSSDIFRTDEIRRAIGDSVPLTIVNNEYDKEDIPINGNTTYALFALNDKLANTKDIGINDNTKRHFITKLLMKGIRIVKRNK